MPLVNNKPSSCIKNVFHCSHFFSVLLAFFSLKIIFKEGTNLLNSRYFVLPAESVKSPMLKDAAAIDSSPFCIMPYDDQLYPDLTMPLNFLLCMPYTGETKN